MKSHILESIKFNERNFLCRAMKKEKLADIVPQAIYFQLLLKMDYPRGEKTHLPLILRYEK